MLLYIVLAFLVPVVMVFGYSVWLHRRRRPSVAVEPGGDPEDKTFSDLVQRCSALKNSVIANDAINIEEDIDSMLIIARSLQDQNLRELSLAQVMGVYVAIERVEEARALLSEVKEETNRARFLEDVFGNIT